ncbi:MAG: hypothetical protein A3K19_30715 [Lentisphaerae bacterium RIFOXYB12_FULL_65_16]|nr:MAG: hypothetical protein A3K18_04180 [Lentisphaerae bacterium RIFOXYA12_64_32]OGV88791.1 MAG: hypothetical protein A3K19_30715 [Lentisphaerae bacterium RIFOXYB12_FULL_65_16]
MARPIVAAQMYTVRDFCKVPKDIVESCKKVAKIGYKAIQTSGMGTVEPMPAADLRKVCDSEGLTICATHISFDLMRDNPAQVIEDHHALGCKWAGIGGAPRQYQENEQTWVKFAKEASEVAAKLSEGGIGFVYHNHSHEFARHGKRTVMQILFEESDPKYFMFEPDTYWVAHGGGSPVAWIRKLAGRCPVVHLKDFAIKPDRAQFYTEIGEGNLDWPGILQACEECGTRWMPVEQDTCPGDPFNSLKISYENLKRWGYR